jgi:hypothetical protein
MLDLKSQSELVDATAAMMRSCVTAATNSFAASAWRGFSLWSDMMLAAGRPRPPAAHNGASAGTTSPFSFWPPPANWLSAPELARWSTWPWLPAAAAEPAKGTEMPWTPFMRTWWLGPSFTMWAPLGDWAQWSKATQQVMNPWVQHGPQVAAPRANPTPETGYSSYRSAGGHAAAQVIVPDAEQLAEVTVSAVLTPMHTMLGVWRAALKG